MKNKPIFGLSFSDIERHSQIIRKWVKNVILIQILKKFYEIFSICLGADREN